MIFKISTTITFRFLDVACNIHKVLVENVGNGLFVSDHTIILAQENIIGLL